MPKVVVIGGGISGLTVGYELMQRGVSGDDLVVLERDGRPGGNLKTHREDGYLIETGPNGFLDNSPPTLDLISRLGMEDRVQPSNDTSAIRFIFSRGKLRKVPGGAGGMLTSGLLPLGGALRVFMEPFIKQGGHPEESVFDFAARRIGKHAAATLVDAMVSGVFAGDSKRLELRAAFPKMAAMEAEYGSLVKAMIKNAAKRKKEGEIRGGAAGPGGRLTSFKTGFEELPMELAIRLDRSLRCGVSAESIEKTDGGYNVVLSTGETLSAKKVVLACPAWLAAGLTADVDEQLSGELGSIETSSITVVASVYEESDLGAPPHGFGLLVPRGHGPRVLGCLWTSSIWEGRAPDGKVLLRTMLGGAHDPAAIKMSDDELLEIIATDLDQIMDLKAPPIMHRIFRYERGISQYHPGHTARLGRIDEHLLRLPGLHVSGSSYKGISVNHCVAEAPGLADRILA